MTRFLIDAGAVRAREKPRVPLTSLTSGGPRGCDVDPRGRSIKKAGGPSGPRLVAPALGGPTARCLARDGHRCPVCSATDGRHRARGSEVHHSEPPPSTGGLHGRAICAPRRQSTRVQRRESTRRNDDVGDTTDDVGRVRIRLRWCVGRWAGPASSGCTGASRRPRNRRPRTSTTTRDRGWRPEPSCPSRRTGRPRGSSRPRSSPI